MLMIKMLKMRMVMVMVEVDAMLTMWMVKVMVEVDNDDYVDDDIHDIWRPSYISNKYISYFLDFTYHIFNYKLYVLHITYFTYNVYTGRLRQKYRFQDRLLWTPYCAFGNLAQNDFPDHLWFLIARHNIKLLTWSRTFFVPYECVCFWIRMLSDEGCLNAYRLLLSLY